jgi:hypothetical protein
VITHRRGTVAPIEMLKLTLVTSSTFSCLIAETIWVRFSAGGAAVAEVAALPVVLASLPGALLSAVGFFTSFELLVVAGLVAAGFVPVSPSCRQPCRQPWTPLVRPYPEQLPRLLPRVPASSRPPSPWRANSSALCSRPSVTGRHSRLSAPRRRELRHPSCRCLAQTQSQSRQSTLSRDRAQK